MKFSLVSPALYEPDIRDACISEQLNGLAKIADIVLRSAPAAKAPIEQSGHGFLNAVRDGTFKASSAQTSPP